MANERDEDQFNDNNDPESASQEGRQKEFGQQAQQRQQDESGQQGQGGSTPGQPIGGNDSTAEGGFVGSQGEESGEYLQEDDAQQGGFAEQGRGAPDEGGDIERGGERTENFDSDIEGSSENR